MEEQGYLYPKLDLLNSEDVTMESGNSADLEEQQKHIIDVLHTFCIPINEIKRTPGFSVIRYEIKPKSGQLYCKMRKCSNDIATCLSTKGVRILSPIPGKNRMAIEMENPNPTTPCLKEVFESDTFINSTMNLSCAIGKTIDKEAFMFDLTELPHLLIGGATGQGKSMCLHDIIISLLFKKSPHELKLVLFDPKGVEFKRYAPLANSFLMKMQGCAQPIITNVDDAILALNVLCELMDKRFDLLKRDKVRNINEYNEKITNGLFNDAEGHKHMPYVVVIIDEIADLKMIAGEDIEMPLVKLAQLGRPVGIHLIITTQRPTYDIITGTIKANFPTSISFKVASNSDSEVLIHTPDAAKLMGKGDMIFSHFSVLTRVQCAFVTEEEISRVVEFIARQERSL